MEMIVALLLVVLVCCVGWAVGEIQGIRVLRIPCVLVILLVGCVLAHGIGSFFGAANASLRVTGATHRFVTAVVRQLDAGHAERAHEELRIVAKGTNETYEGAAYVEQMQAATERLASR